VETLIPRYAGKQFSAFKQDLIEIAVGTLGPIGAEMSRLMADPAAIDAILRDGRDRAGAIATPILHKTQDIIGLLRP
jgi:tryptophanyl-tRNA synthetase